ncbi:hypothetical protein D3H65_22080 [Paraflavitalea soli]|uniref:Beta-lactamase-inhibitor-like PepSY-like domain-containing protein n=1 Tax=Paraflavitalea soli TaxID=2315862 RepID=A0A3B7N2F4_9BACT|nr:hypothetical protein [Paraflavitalea soli]AXY76521.1 hypothetical protein D3H65_22080 [Paraflavitalea soli]
MKKTILTWVLLLTVGLSSTFANKLENVNEQVISSFKKDFASAQDVSWEKSKEISKATFKLNDQVMFAYYAEDGNLLAVMRNIVSSQLPINLLSDLKKNYSSYWISDLFEMASDNSTAYYVTVQNGDQTLVLKSFGSVGWETFKKDKK